MIKVGVVGGTGYTGVELLRLLAQHPEVEIKAITSRGEAGLPVAGTTTRGRRWGAMSGCGASIDSPQTC